MTSWAMFAVKITVHPDPDGLYLLKGGDRQVWDHFNIKKEWRKSQGIVHGKRCGIFGMAMSASPPKADMFRLGSDVG